MLAHLSCVLRSFLCRTDPADVARVESKTFIVTRDKHTTIPRSEAGAKGGMGLWMDPAVMQVEMDERFKNCMAGELLALSFRCDFDEFPFKCLQIVFIKYLCSYSVSYSQVFKSLINQSVIVFSPIRLLCYLSVTWPFHKLPWR